VEGGSLAAGAVADAFGALAIAFVCGVKVAASRAAFAAGLKGWMQAIRPVCVRQGLISGAHNCDVG